MTKRRLTDGEERELAELNAAVTMAIGIRRDWLDAKMAECSDLQVGDDIYDVDSGYRLGTVSKLYRFWRDRDEGVRDASEYCDYEYRTAGGSFDNTSRQTGLSYGTRADAIRRAERRTRELRSQ